MVRFLRRSLILAHRYLGIALGVLVVVWFASGIVMIWAGGMPAVGAEMLLERLPAIDLSKVDLTLSDAIERVQAGAGGRGGRGARLTTVMERPAYRVGARTVFADTGEIMSEITPEEAGEVAARFAGVSADAVGEPETITEVDQWTLSQRGSLPLYKFAVGDGRGTEVYVDPGTADVAMMTTRRARLLAWTGTIPHWLYFTALRVNQPLWYRIVVWTSGAVCVLALLGLALGFTQFRRQRPFRLSGAIPYSGWMRWHYITGAVFGIFTLTWAFSGLLSMEPFAWTNATGLGVPGNAMTGGVADPERFGNFDPEAWERALGGRAIREMSFARIQDAHYYVVRLAPEVDDAGEAVPEPAHRSYGEQTRSSAPVLVEADTLEVRTGPFSAASLLGRLEAALPEERIIESALIGTYDSYYYSRAGQLPLPVLRVKFDDPAETWVYIDPEMSQVMGALPKLARLERWLYNGLHSLDFAFWYTSWTWEAGMVFLLLGGLATSVLGLVMGLKRLGRGLTRAGS